MASVLRVAIGRCSCIDPQPDIARQVVCRELTRKLEELRSRETTQLKELPPYSEIRETIDSYRVIFETIREPHPDAIAIIVMRAFFHTWRQPTWISFAGVGHMFADGFVLREDGTTESAADEYMWDFR